MKICHFKTFALLQRVASVLLCQCNMSTLLDTYDVEAAFEEELQRVTEVDCDGALQDEECSQPCTSGTGVPYYELSRLSMIESIRN